MGKNETTYELDPKMKALQDALKSIDPNVRQEAWTSIQEASYDMRDEIKDAMPVDTGRAKAGWGMFTPEDLAKGAKQTTKGRPTKSNKYKGVKFETRPMHNVWKTEGGRTQIASSEDAIWIEDEASGSITQGTNVPYTQYLNEGHSANAPMGFIDDAFERARIALGKLGDTINVVINDTILGNYRPRALKGKSISEMVAKYSAAIRKK